MRVFSIFFPPLKAARPWDTSTLPSGASDFLRCKQRSSPKKWGRMFDQMYFDDYILYNYIYIYNNIYIWFYMIIIYIDMCNRLICWLIYTCLRIQMIAKYSYEDMCFVSSAFIFCIYFCTRFRKRPLPISSALDIRGDVHCFGLESWCSRTFAIFGLC